MSIQQLGNRLAIVILSSFFVVLETVDARAVIGILLTFSISCIGLYTERYGVILLTTGCYLAAVTGCPIFILTFPVILYELTELLQKKVYRRWVVGLLILMGVEILWYLSAFLPEVIVGESLVAVLAVWLNRISFQYENARRRLITTRDNSTELERKLKQENQILLQKQDSDIYAATLKERNRIAREIHDNVGHMLSRAILMIGALLTVSKEEGTREGLNGLKECLDEAMTNIRESVHDLHDESVDLEQAIQNMSKDMEGYCVKIEYDMSEHIPREIKYCMIAIVKESLSNVMRHSLGDCVQIALTEHPGLYKLAVEDNGCCCMAETMTGGIGLYNMKDRVDSLSGTLNIRARNTGFQVHVSIPKKVDYKE